jgi:3-oxoacyl-[acyl-carrier protein] reductase
MDLGLADARVLVVGGSRGMGRAAAETFAREGARVAVLARASAALDDTVATLPSCGSPESIELAADLKSLVEVNAAVDRLGERWDGLEVLVNAAGPVDVGIGAFEGLDDDEWRATFDIGVLSAVRTVRRALPLLRRGSFARIVNVSAHSTRRQSPDLVAYTAAKAALTSLTKNLSQALAPDGILVNTVSPGSFLSEGMQGYLRSLPPERGIDSKSLTDAMQLPTRCRSSPRTSATRPTSGAPGARRRSDLSSPSWAPARTAT